MPKRKRDPRVPPRGAVRWLEGSLRAAVECFNRSAKNLSDFDRASALNAFVFGWISGEANLPGGWEKVAAATAETRKPIPDEEA